MKTNTQKIIVIRAQYGISVLMLAAVATYAYLLCSSVAFAVGQKEVTFRSAQVRESLAVLEAEYLSRTSSFTQSKATDLGLVAISSKDFASAERTIGILDTRRNQTN